MRKGNITQTDIENLKAIANNPDKFEEWLTYIKNTEPEFYMFIQDTTSKIISSFGQNVKFSIQDAHILAHSILMAFTAGMAMVLERNDAKIERMYDVKAMTDKFQLWLNGKMPDVYYDYSLRGLDKESSKYQAKSNHIRLMKEMKESISAEKEIQSFSEFENTLHGKTVSDTPKDILSDNDMGGI